MGDVSAQFDDCIVLWAGERRRWCYLLETKLIVLEATCVPSSRSKIGSHRAVKMIAAGLGDDLNDATQRLAVLRFECRRLDVDFLNKGEVDSRSECTMVAVV